MPWRPTGVGGPGAVAGGTAEVGCGAELYRTVAKNVRTSSTNNSGCSKAAKCPPRGIVVQCVMLYAPSHQLRGVRRISFVNATPPADSRKRWLFTKQLKLSPYSRAEEAPLPVTQERITLSSNSSQ